MKGRKDVKMAEKRMDGQCIFRFLFFKSSYLEIQSMFVPVKKKKSEIILQKKQGQRSNFLYLKES